MPGAKRKSLTAVAAPVVKQSAKSATKTRIDETRTAVSTGQAAKATAKSQPETIEISSDSESQYSFSEDEGENKKTEAQTPKLKQSQDEDVEMDAPQDEAVEGSNTEEDAQTFGDLVRASTTVDVPASLAAAEVAAQASRSQVTQRSVAPMTSTSLGTVLNQALRTDDSDLLESCLATSDQKIITNTINRMDSALAGVLLSKLAARMHRRPGRAFGLMKWMQLTLIAHGGSLVTQPDLVNRLSELNRVLEERSKGLSSLLALKGKLDMLDGQMRMRKAIKTGDRDGSDVESDLDDDEEVPGVVYVEGEDVPVQGSRAALTNGRAVDEDDFPVANGVDNGDDSDEEDSDYEEMEEGDFEALADESLDEDEVDHDDVEESGDEEEEDDDEDAGPPAKVQKVASKFAKRP